MALSAKGLLKLEAVLVELGCLSVKRPVVPPASDTMTPDRQISDLTTEIAQQCQVILALVALDKCGYAIADDMAVGRELNAQAIELIALLCRRRELVVPENSTGSRIQFPPNDRFRQAAESAVAEEVKNEELQVASEPPAVALTCRKSAHLDNWYIIEGVDHENRSWSDADIEGPLGEMMAIAGAIKARRQISFERCAVRTTSEDVRFWSPRNSRTEARVSFACALMLADEIMGMAKKLIVGAS